MNEEDCPLNTTINLAQISITVTSNIAKQYVIQLIHYYQEFILLLRKVSMLV